MSANNQVKGHGCISCENQLAVANERYLFCPNAECNRFGLFTAITNKSPSYITAVFEGKIVNKDEDTKS